MVVVLTVAQGIAGIPRVLPRGQTIPERGRGEENALGYLTLERQLKTTGDTYYYYYHYYTVTRKTSC